MKTLVLNMGFRVDEAVRRAMQLHCGEDGLASKEAVLTAIHSVVDGWMQDMRERGLKLEQETLADKWPTGERRGCA